MTDETKKLSDAEKEKLIDKAINFSIIKKLLNLKLIDEKQYYLIKKRVESLYD